jgi:hypothetical protein
MSGIMSRKIKSLITGACWNSIAKVTSPFCDRRVRFSGAIFGDWVYRGFPRGSDNSVCMQ